MGPLHGVGSAGLLPASSQSSGGRIISGPICSVSSPVMDEHGTPVGRRVFFGLVGLGAAGILLGARVQDWLEREVGPLIAKDGTGLASLLPIGRFRIYTVTGGLPSRSRPDYQLRVRGLVNEELRLSYADITAMKPTALTRDFQCVTGWRVPEVQ